MRNYQKRSKKNPFLENFLRSALVFLIILTILFSHITISNVKETKNELYQSQVDLIAEDWAAQMEQLEEIYLRIRVNPKYQPSYFSQNKYREITLLEDFKQYANYSVLTDECVLYYRELDSFFHSSGTTKNISVYIQNYTEEEKEQLVYALTRSDQRVYLPIGSSLFFFFPMKSVYNKDTADAVLVFKIEQRMLNTRFQMVSGGLVGTIALHHNGALLYSDLPAGSQEDPESILTAITSDGNYTFSYCPHDTMSTLLSISPLQYVMLAVMVVLLFLIALFFAQRTYRPVQNIVQKYETEEFQKNRAEYSNALEEIDYQLSYMRQRNISITHQLSEKQKIIRQQLLHDLLHGNINYNLQPFLEQAQITLPGACYYAVSIQFETAEEEAASFLTDLQEELENLTSEADNIFVYTLANLEKYQINAICSVQTEQQAQQLNKYIGEIVNNATYLGVIGLGNLCRDIHKIPASWLESVDNIHNAIKSKGTTKEGQWLESQYYTEKSRRFFFYLANGDEEKAYDEFRNYMDIFKSGEVSFLLQQYIFTCFVSECSKIAISNGIVLGNRNLALMLSADRASAFCDAVTAMMQEYFEKLKHIQHNEQQETLCEICDYLQKHFMEYDISVEKVAEHFNTNSATVRQAITAKTGYKYKEYVISLRISLAKKLLLSGNAPITEICAQVGYGNVSHFVTLFKKQTGVSPSEFRQYHKNTDANRSE